MTPLQQAFAADNPLAGSLAEAGRDPTGKAQLNHVLVALQGTTEVFVLLLIFQGRQKLFVCRQRPRAIAPQFLLDVVI